MDKTKFSEMLAFVNDEKRFDAAFDNVLEGIETGRIRADDFPIAAAPLRAGGLKDNREFVARFLEQAAGLTLSASASAAAACPGRRRSARRARRRAPA